MPQAVTKQPEPAYFSQKVPQKSGSTEYWEILANIASGKEKVYSHEYVMAELRKVLKK